MKDNESQTFPTLRCQCYCQPHPTKRNLCSHFTSIMTLKCQALECGGHTNSVWLGRVEHGGGGGDEREQLGVPPLVGRQVPPGVDHRQADQRVRQGLEGRKGRKRRDERYQTDTETHCTDIKKKWHSFMVYLWQMRCEFIFVPLWMTMHLCPEWKLYKICLGSVTWSNFICVWSVLK